MKVLVVDNAAAAHEATSRLLDAESHSVTLVENAAAALALLEETDFDVVLVESTLAGVTGSELVKRIRALETGGEHVFVIMTSAERAHGDVTTAFAAGADDFIRKPIGKDELHARLDGPSRMLRWVSRAMTRAGVAPASAKPDLSALSAWSSVDSAICSEVGDMLGMSLSVVAANDVLDGSIAVSALPLSLTSESTEVCFAVGIDHASSTALAESIFGDAGVDAAAIRDMIGEIVNVAAGAFKRDAAAEGRSFTTGIPEEASPESFRRPNATARRQWLVASEGTPICLRFEVELRVRETKHLPIAELEEGMVMAKDLRDEGGTLVVGGGTRLTETTLATMREALGSIPLVEIAEVG